MRKHSFWKRTAAGILALTLVTGGTPVNMEGFLTGGTGIVASAKDPGMTIGEEYTYAEIKGKMDSAAYCYLATYALPDEAFNVKYSDLESNYKDYLLGMISESSYENYHNDETDDLHNQSQEEYVKLRKWKLVGQPAGDNWGDCIFKAASMSINIPDTENGTVAVDNLLPMVDDTITLTITPDEGYGLDSLTVENTYTNETIPVTNNQFTMPDGDVTVKAVFVKGQIKAATGLVYDREPKALIDQSTVPTDVTVKYAVTDANANSAPAADSEEWLDEIPQKTNAGTYKVWYSITSDDPSYNGVTSGSVDVEIANADITLTAKDGLTYNANPQKLVTVDPEDVSILFAVQPESSEEQSFTDEMIDDKSNRDAYKRIQGESFDQKYGNLGNEVGSGSTGSDNNSTLASIHANEWAKYSNVDFGNGIWTQGIKIEYSNAGTVGSKCSVWLDNLEANGGTKIGTLEFPVTGNWQTYQSSVIPVENALLITGKHDIYFQFEYDGTAGNPYICNIDYFLFAGAPIVWDNAIPQRIDAGTYRVWYKTSDTETNYSLGGKTVDYVDATIAKIDPTVTAPTLKTGLIAGETAQELIEAAGTTNGGDLQYAVTTEDAAPTDASAWKSAIADITGTKAGTYYVWYKADANTNYNAVEATKAGEVTIAVNPKFCTAPPKITATNSSTGTSGTDDQNPNKLFDGDITDGDSKWCVTDINNYPEGKKDGEYVYVTFDIGSAQVLKSYTLTTGQDTSEYPNRNPKSWIMYGTNTPEDDFSWTVLDSVTDDTRLPPEDSQSVKYELAKTPDAYRYYKFELRGLSDGDQWSDGCMQLAEMSVETEGVGISYHGVKEGTDKWTWDYNDGNPTAQFAFTCGKCGDALTFPADSISALDPETGLYTATITIDGEDFTSQYGWIKPTVSISSWVVGETESEATVDGNPGNGKVTFAYKPKDADDSEYTTDVPTAAGNYTVRASVAATEKYSGGAATADFAITKVVIDPAVTIEGWTYGDTAKDPSVDGNPGDADPTYVYKVKGADDKTYTKDVPTAAGEYTVKATIAETANYQAGEATADFVIEKKALTITAQNAEKVFGTKDPALTYAEVKLVGEDKLTGALTRAEGENVGGYAITQGDLTAGDNYAITFVPGKLTITAAEFKVDASGFTGTYDGKPHGISASADVKGAAVYYLVSDEKPTEVDFNKTKQTASPTYTNADTYKVW